MWIKALSTTQAPNDGSLHAFLASLTRGRVTSTWVRRKLGPGVSAGIQARRDEAGTLGVPVAVFRDTGWYATRHGTCWSLHRRTRFPVRNSGGTPGYGRFY